MKAVCLALGVARSNLHARLNRSDDWADGRTARVRNLSSDAMLIDAVRAEITALPTYGYRRAGALVNRTRSLIGLRPVNHKRFYRLMREHQLLLPKTPKRRASSRPHEGKVAVLESNTRWCSDGFEIACDSGGRERYGVASAWATKAPACSRQPLRRRRTSVAASFMNV